MFSHSVYSLLYRNIYKYTHILTCSFCNKKKRNIETGKDIDFKGERTNSELTLILIKADFLKGMPSNIFYQW